jgi:hypothetical protein
LAACSGQRGLRQGGDGVDDRPALGRVDRAADPLDGPANGVDDPAEDLSQLILAVGLQHLGGELVLPGRRERRLAVLGLLAQHPHEQVVEELLLSLARGPLALPVLALLVFPFLEQAAEQAAEDLASDRDQRQEPLLLALPVAPAFVLPLPVALALVPPGPVTRALVSLVLALAVAGTLVLPRPVARCLPFTLAVARALVFAGAVAGALPFALPVPRPFSYSAVVCVPVSNIWHLLCWSSGGYFRMGSDPSPGANWRAAPATAAAAEADVVAARAVAEPPGGRDHDPAEEPLELGPAGHVEQFGR